MSRYFTMYDWGRFKHQMTSAGREEVWRAGGGREIRIRDLSDEHLINILNWIETTRGERVPNSDQKEKYFWLRLEAMRRGLRWREYANMKLREGDLTKPKDSYVWAEERIALHLLVGKRVRMKLSDWHTSPMGPTRSISGRVESVEILPEGFKSYELDELPLEAPRSRQIVRLRDMSFDDKFRIKGKHLILQRARLYGEIGRSLERDRGYRLSHYAGICVGPDGVERCAVISEGSKTVFLQAADAEVERL